MWSYDGREFEAPLFELGMSPAGNLYSNVLDLGKFLICLLDGGSFEGKEIISKAGLEDMWTIQFSNDSNSGYGLGFRISDFNGYKRIGHGGAIYGYSTQIYGIPELGIGAVCASSVYLTNSITSRLSEYALELLIASGSQQPLPDYKKTENLVQGEIGELVGFYKSDNSWLKMKKKNNKLWLETDRIEIKIKKQNDHYISDGRLDFGGYQIIKSADGILVNGKEYKSYAPPKTSEFPVEWNELIGEYGWDHNVLSIYEDQGSLWALIEWFEKDKLAQISKDIFAFPELGSMYCGEKLVFNKDESTRKVVNAEIKNGPVFERRWKMKDFLFMNSNGGISITMDGINIRLRIFNLS